jgi:hypothetical protein
LDFHASPGRFGRDLHTSKILRSISDRPRQLIDRVRTLATVLGALRRLARAAILPALHRRKSERRGCPSKSMASGDLTITLSRVGSFRAGRHGDHNARTSHLPKTQNPRRAGQGHASGWLEARVWSRCQAKDPRHPNAAPGFLLAHLLSTSGGPCVQLWSWRERLPLGCARRRGADGVSFPGMPPQNNWRAQCRCCERAPRLAHTERRPVPRSRAASHQPNKR